MDSKNPYVMTIYARYLMSVKGDFEKSREYLNKALLAAPVSYYINISSAEYYLFIEDYDAALKEAERAKELSPIDGWAPWIAFLAYVNKGEHDLAVNELVDNWSLSHNYNKNVAPMLQAYKENGINGVFRWINDLDINHADEERVQHNAYYIAQKFAFLGEHDKAMQWLNIGFKRKNGEMNRIKHDHFFTDMHDNPEFLSLLEKMNLGNYKQSPYFKD
ncbi:tetratricopeptide repeat protein [Flavisericum labens]|uniref:tetratricopeptide repeat protein n=1 Tax=Flavisericum labens TaxID=3377112 RepID=UPI00387AD386